MERLTPKQARLLAGLTQEEMAKELDIYINTYINKEKGTTRFYVDEALKFCQVVNQPIEKIIFFTNNVCES